MIELTIWDLFVIVVALGLAGALQFFRGRKINLVIMSESVKLFERILKPRDKEYRMIGLYVGYSGILKIGRDGIKEVELTLVLLPRQSLLYFPISLLTSRFDKVFLRYVVTKRIPWEAHLIRKGYYRLGIRRVIRGIEKMFVTETEIGGVKYYMVYNNATAAKTLVNLVKRLEKPDLIQHVALVPKNMSLFIASKLKMEYLEDIVRQTYREASRLKDVKW